MRRLKLKKTFSQEDYGNIVGDQVNLLVPLTREGNWSGQQNNKKNKEFYFKFTLESLLETFLKHLSSKFEALIHVWNGHDKSNPTSFFMNSTKPA